MADKNDKIGLNEYIDIWLIATIIHAILALMLVLGSSKIQYLFLILVPTVLIPIWMAINAIASSIRTFIQKKKLKNNPLLTFEKSLNDVSHLIPYEGLRIYNCVKDHIEGLKRFPISDISNEILIFAETASAMLQEYGNKADMLCELDDKKSDEIGLKVITQIYDDFQKLVTAWVEDTTDDIEASMISWSATLNSTTCLTPQEEMELTIMEEENV